MSNDHFVPQMLLRNFIDSTGRIHVLNKKRKDKKIDPYLPENVFSENHFHSAINTDNTKDRSLETFFNRDVETPASPIIQEILISVRCGIPPKLTWKEREIWWKFFLYQQRRTPDSLNDIFSPENFLAVLKNIRHDLMIKGQDAPDETMIKLLAKHGTFQQNVKVGALRVLNPETLNIFCKMGSINFARIQLPKKTFLIGSRSVVEVRPKAHSHKYELWFPLAYDVAVNIALTGTRDITVSSIISYKTIRLINEAVFRQSTYVGAQNPQIIRECMKKSIFNRKKVNLNCSGLYKSYMSIFY